MKKWLLALLLIPTLSFGKGPERAFPVNNFSRGVDTYHSPLTLPDGYVQDSLNVFFDQTSPAEKRTGFNTVFTSATFSYTGLWHYTDPTNTAWIIARSSNTILASNLSGTTVKIATVSATNIVNEVNAFGSAYFTDQTQGVYFWNGTSTTFVSGSPKGSLIEQFHGRVWVAGQAIPNGNILNASKYLDGTTWTTGTNATDPAQFTIDLGDNYDVLSALYGSVNDTLYLFKQFSVSALYGFDNTDFTTRQLNREDGCVDSRSIQAYNKGLVLMGSKGIEYFDGYSFSRISDPIKNKVKGAVQSTFSQASCIQTSQADFQTGVSSPSTSLSFTIAPGDITPSTYSVTDSSFSLGNLSNVVIGNGGLRIDINSGNVPNNSFESSLGSEWTNSGFTRTGSSHGTDHCNVTADDGVEFMYTNNSGYVNPVLTAKLYDSSNNLLQSITIDGTFGGCGWTTAILSSTGNLRKRVYVKFSDGSNTLTSASFMLGGDVTFAYYRDSETGGLHQFIAFDFLTGGYDSISTGTFTSRTLDLGFTSGEAIASADTVQNDFPVLFSILTATDSGGPFVNATSALNSNFATNRYVKYIASFTWTGSNNAIFSQFNSLTLVAAATGTYLSAVHNDPNLTTWGNFNVNDTPSSGALTYSVRAATSVFSINSTTPSWTTQTKNALVTISTGTYFQMKADFALASAVNVPSIQDFSFNWFSGTRSPPMASAVYDNRYWLSLTTNTVDTQNDATVVLNRSGIWSILSIPAGAFTLSKGTLYHADANATGNVYQDDTGYTDNGTAIDAYIRTKEYMVDDWIHDDFFYDLWIAADNSGPYSISSSYYVDGGTTAYTLSSALENEKIGRLYLKLPIGIDSTHQNFASSISFKFEEADNNAPWRFYGAYLNYKQRPIQ